MNRLLFSIFFLVMALGQMSAQIINIENKRISTDTIGLSGNVSMALSASKFTQSFLAAELESHVQWKSSKNIFLIVGDFQIVNAGGENFNNSGYGHFRFNRKLSSKVRLELFTQVQYNSVTKITARYLNGVGLRFKLSPYENAKIYWGIAAMHEYEEISFPEVTNNDIRLSSYMSFTLAPVKTITFRNTTYVQPLTSDFKDYRLSNNTRINFGITENLRFTTDFQFLYDSRPPTDVPNINYQIKNGLTYRFI